MFTSENHPPHIYTDHACYFITASTLQRQWLFNTDSKRALLRNVLEEAVEDYGITLHAWVILANHYHLLLDVSDKPIYKFIKRLHGDSAIQLNKLDGRPGRQVWYQYWDRFPRGEHDFWGYFNYTHLNPIKHRYVTPADVRLYVADGKVLLLPSQLSGIHLALSHYPFSSYHEYSERYGVEFHDDAWMRYPIPDYLEHDDF